MHVYAPGSPGYRVTPLNMTPQPYVRTMPLRYPASEIYHFVPLNERVPVYQKPFTLLMDVVPEATAEAQKASPARTNPSWPEPWKTRPATTRSATTPCRFRSRGGLPWKGKLPGVPQPAQK